MNRADLEMVAKQTLGIFEEFLDNFGIDFRVVPQQNALPCFEIKGKKSTDKIIFQLNNLFRDVFYSDPKTKEIDQRLKDVDYATAKIYGVVSAKIRTLLIILNYEGQDLENKLIEMAKNNSVNVRMLWKEL